MEPSSQPGLADPGWIPRIPKLRPRRLPPTIRGPAHGSLWIPNRKSTCYVVDPVHLNQGCRHPSLAPHTDLAFRQLYYCRLQ